MNQIDLGLLAANWIAYWHGDSAKRLELSGATYLHDLTYEQPEELWLLILEIHHRDQTIAIQEVLSAGPVEDLLAMHGDTFIERVEAEARRDPLFAKLLGGVWKSNMSDAIWDRLQAVWDRRGWDGTPE
jgi:hypothetical protein